MNVERLVVWLFIWLVRIVFEIESDIKEVDCSQICFNSDTKTISVEDLV